MKQGLVQSFLAWTVWVVEKSNKRSGRRVGERLAGIVFVSRVGVVV